MITGFWLLIIFLASIAFLLLTVIRFKLNPFIALLVTCIVTGVLVGMPLAQISETIATGFGNTLKGIGIVIGLGIIFGRILSQAGATEQIAYALIRAVGDRNSPLAVTFTGYLVSIPVFFDAAFVILVSLVRKLASLTKRPMVLFVTALSVGLITTHNMVIPTPGPVEVANNLKLNMGTFTIYALLVAIPGALVGGWLYGLFLGKKIGFTKADEEMGQDSTTQQTLPSVGISFTILLLPIALILVGSIMALFLPTNSAGFSFFSFIGNKNIALLISVLAAILLLRKNTPEPVSRVIADAGEKAGLILLITGAGGAFGYVITTSGIGTYLVDTLAKWNISIILTGFILAALLRGAQGSSTVALVTASSILGPIASQSSVSPVIIALAICAGGSCLSLPNDSGFWVVTRFSGLAINDTMKAWTLGGSLSGVVTLMFILILSLFAGILPGLH